MAQSAETQGAIMIKLKHWINDEAIEMLEEAISVIKENEYE